MKMRLAEITSKYVGAPYKLGGWSKKDGFDCVSLICTIGEEFGVKVPKAFGGYRRSNYPSIWRKNPLSAKKLLCKFAASLGEQIDPVMAFAPDLLLLQGRGQDLPILGIHGGNDLVLSAFVDVGVDLANIRGYDVRKAYRWVT